jgi:phosphatidylserine/phosphatidylglycerophosphate/cardiolipin synthase-like enzyme
VAVRRLVKIFTTALVLSHTPAFAQEIAYAPETNLSEIDVSLIQNAESEIDLAAYVLTDCAIIEALNDAQARGVKVRIILDPRQHSDLARLIGEEVRRKRPGPIQHLKAYEIDHQLLRTGSENFSHSAPRRTTTSSSLRTQRQWRSLRRISLKCGTRLH